MKFTPRNGFSSYLLSSVVVLLALAGFAYGAAEVPAAEAPAAAAAPPAARLTAVRAGVSPEATTLAVEVAGEFTCFASASGEKLVFVDLPGVLSTQPSESHLLASRFVSSYRVVPYLADGRASARLEVLLKHPAAVSYQQKPGAVLLKFVPASKTTVAGAASLPALPAPAPAPPPAPVAGVEAKPAAVQAKTETPAAHPIPAKRARGSLIEKVTFAREDGGTRVQILTNGPVEYRAFQLTSPPRLVVDIPEVESRAGLREVLVGAPPLKSIRVAQFSQRPLVSRVVIDLDSVAAYRVHPRESALEVEVKAPGARLSAPPAEPSAARPPQEEPVMVASNAAPPTVPEKPPERAPEVTVPSSLALNLPAPQAASQAEPAQPVAAAQPENPPAVTPQPPVPVTVAAAVPPPLPAQQPAPTALAPQQPAPAPAQQPASVVAGPRYTGEPISVNLKDIDLKDFFRLIHEISGLNIVLDPNVSGKVTIVLEDVPWDQALDIVLRNNGLDKQLEGNVLRIARRDTIRREEEDRLALETAKQAAADRVTVMRSLNYARSAQLVTTLTKFRSPRGEIIADERTNTLIITDIPQVIPTIDDIIRQLDRRSLQVEIEARVVAASRSFAREVGAQFGFGTTASSGKTVFGGNPVGQINNQSPINPAGGFPPGRPFDVNTPSSVPGLLPNLPLFSNFPAAGANVGFSILHRSPNAAVDFVLTLAETKGVGKLLSRPRIITQNNIEAEVQQGVRIPVQTTINNTISVQFFNVTLRLTVRPQVTNEGTIFLDVTVENTTIDPGIPRINGVPALDTQLARSQVLVNDGGTIVFGGVLQNNNNLTILQVPVLGSIPIIGNLFKRTGITTNTNELLFFITPKIV